MAFFQVSRSKPGRPDTLMSAMTHSSPENTKTIEQHSDRELLRRFVQDGDENAFAQIVVRHAPLVMSVCRRVVGQSADVDDAFQATFFALSRRPHSIYECLSLAGWLYSVAFRASVRLVRLRKRTMMQALPEHIRTTEPDPLDQIAVASDLAALDAELNGLPEKYRNVLVMSYFAQHTNQEIADQLKESKGAVDGRIRDARKMLRVRLARRGVEIGVLTIAAAMTQSTASAASPALIRTTIGFGSSVFSSTDAESMLAVNETQLNLLTSTGISLMSIKSGLIAAASLLALTAVIGISRLAAIQDGASATDGTGTIDTTETATASATAVEDSASISASVSDVVIEAREGAARGVRVTSGDSVLEAGSVTFTDTASATMNSSSADATTAERPLKGALAEFSRKSERTAERELNLLMAGMDMPALEYPGEESLASILHYVAEYLSETTGRKVLILPDVSDPDIESIDYLNSVNVSSVYIPEGSMTLASALDLIFARVMDQELTWMVKDEVLMITTRATAESEENLILRSYDISRVREQSDVLFPDYPQNIGGQGGGFGGGGHFQVTEKTPAASGAAGTDSAPGDAGLASDGNAEDKRSGGQGRRAVDLTTPQTLTWEYALMQVVMEMTSPPCLWIQNGDAIGTLAVAGNRLIVRQTRVGHEAVIEVLDALEDAAEEAAESSGDSESSVK